MTIPKEMGKAKKSRGYRTHPSPVALVAALGLLRCSASVGDFEACSTNDDCRSAFGPSYVCATDGLCTPATPDPRCTRTVPADLFSNRDAYRDRIWLGTLYSYVDHLDTQRATELAFLEANRENGVNGRLFALIHCDYASRSEDNLTDIEATTRTTTFLARDIGVPAIIGPRGSSRTSAAFLAARDFGTLVISPSATSPALTNLDGVDKSDENPGLLWRTAPPDSLQGRVLAQDMGSEGVRTVAILYRPDSYGNGLSEIILADGPSYGLSIRRVPFEDPGLADRITDLASATEDAVVFISSDIAEVVDFLNGASASESLRTSYLTKRIYLSDSASDDQILEETTTDARTLFPQIRGTRPSNARGTRLYDRFSAGYALEYSTDPQSSNFTPHAYDAGWLVAYGSGWSIYQEGSISSLGIARGLRKVSSGVAIDIRQTSWTDVLEAFRRGESIDIRGASGSLDFDPVTEETTASIDVWRISGSNLERIYQVEP